MSLRLHIGTLSGMQLVLVKVVKIEVVFLVITVAVIS